MTRLVEHFFFYALEYLRPKAMGVNWDDVARTLRGLRAFVEETGLWYTIANEATITDGFIDRIRDRIEHTFGAWQERGSTAIVHSS